MICHFWTALGLHILLPGLDKTDWTAWLEYAQI